MPRDASELLDDLRSAGLSVSLRGDRIAVRPASKLTPAIKGEVQRLRVGIVELLGGSSPQKYREPQRYQPMNPRDPFWSDPTARDAQEDLETALGGEDRFKEF